MQTASEVVNRAYSRGLRPPPRLTVSEWAEANRIVTAPSPNLGPWRNEKTPYLVGPMDLLSPFSAARIIALMKGSQVGATEAALNWTGYTVDLNPTSMMIVLPDQGTAKEWSGLRLDRLIESTACLAGKIADPRLRDSGNSWQTKKFRGGFLKFTWASSAKKLRSTPAENIVADEVDGFETDTKGEGDPVTSLKRRFTNFPRGKLFLASTPTLKSESRIEREFEAGDQRFYFVQCPECGYYQRFAFATLKYENDDPETVCHLCLRCDARIPERFKTQMLASGIWLATAGYAELRERGFAALKDVQTVIGEMERAEEVSLHLSALYSPIGWYSWRTLVKNWVDAHKPTKKQNVLKVIVNQIFGETWKDEGISLDWEKVRGKAEDYLFGTAPLGVLFLTAGIDVQHDRIEVAIWGWGRGGQCWLVSYEIIEGAPENYGTWLAVDKVIGQLYKHESGALLPISKVGVDSGDGKTIEFVYQWVKRQSRAWVHAIKGTDHGPIISVPNLMEVTARGKRRKWGLRVWSINVSQCKSALYGHLQLPMPDLDAGESYPEGYIHYPKMADAWYKQLVAEEWRPGKPGKPGSWVLPDGRRNEALDTWDYAFAMAHLEGRGIQNMTENDWLLYEGRLNLFTRFEEPAVQESLEFQASQRPALNPPVVPTQPAPAPAPPQPPVAPYQQQTQAPARNRIRARFSF